MQTKKEIALTEESVSVVVAETIWPFWKACRDLHDIGTETKICKIDLIRREFSNGLYMSGPNYVTEETDA